MTQRLVLVAASGLAREAAMALHTTEGYAVLGCLDDDHALWGRRRGTLDVLGGVDTASDLDDDIKFVVCAGKGLARRLLTARLGLAGISDERFATIVHPSVDVPGSVQVGPGSILLAHVALTADVTVGRHVVAMPQVTITHDDVVEDFATLCAGVTLGGQVRVAEAAYLGMNACVREGVTVGRQSMLGMGSVLTRNLPEDQTWAGNPARPLVREQQGVPA